MHHARTVARLVADCLHPSSPWMHTSIALGRPYRPQYRFRNIQTPRASFHVGTREPPPALEGEPEHVFHSPRDTWDDPVRSNNGISTDDVPTASTSNTLAWSTDSALTFGYDSRVLVEQAKIQGRTSAEVHSVLRVAASEGQVTSIYKVQACVNYLLKELDEGPSAKLYAALILKECRADGSIMEVERLLDEMGKEGFEVDSGCCHDILKVLAVHPDYVLRTEVLAYMRAKWFQLSEGGWHDVAASLVREGSLEMAMERLEGMQTAGVRILAWLWDMLIYALLEREELDEVLRLLQMRQQSGPHMISGTMWYHLLDVSARLMHYDLASFVWKTRVRMKYMNPSNGICLNVMTIASRYNDPDLAQDVFDFLSRRDTIFEPQHYELLIEAYVHAGIPENGFYILSAMQRANVIPTSGTTRRLVAYLQAWHDSTRINQMFAVLQQLKAKESPVPIAAVNALIEAATVLHDHELTMNLYHAIPDLCVTGADTTTYNHLFRLCNRSGESERAENKSRALQLASEMVAAHVQPDALTYDRMMLVCLQGGATADYEDGYRYFKEMRARGFEPRFGSVLVLVRCLTKWSDKRVDEVLDDIEGMNLPIRIGELRKWVKAEFGKKEEVAELEFRGLQSE